MSDERNPLLDELFSGLYPKNKVQQNQQNAQNTNTNANQNQAQNEAQAKPASVQTSQPQPAQAPLANPSAEQPKVPSNIDPAQKEDIKKVIDELKSKMGEIDKIIAELKKREEKEKNLPKKTEMLLTEIKVPSLELLK